MPEKSTSTRIGRSQLEIETSPSILAVSAEDLKEKIGFLEKIGVKVPSQLEIETGPCLLAITEEEACQVKK